MKKFGMKKLLSALLAGVMLLSLAACAGNEGFSTDGLPTDVPNGDFEEVNGSKWVSWTKELSAFNAKGLVTKDSISGITMEKSGKTFFSGSDGGNPAMSGTLTSEVFKLSDTGVITFKMGAGKDTEKVYVEFIQRVDNDPAHDKVLAKVANTDCDGVYISEHLITKVVDLSQYVGSAVYIRVTDIDDGNDLSYVNLDGFRTCKDQAEVDAAKADHDRQIKEFGAPEFHEDPTSTTIQNGGFENGDLSGWMVLSGSALKAMSIVPTSQYYWDDRMVYGEGSYYFDGSNNGAIPEGAVGAMRSTKFTLAGDGYISFMMGAGNGDCYVAICDGNDDAELIKVYNNSMGFSNDKTIYTGGFADPARALMLLRTYVDASAYLGRVLYIKVVDANDGGGFAFINVDDFRVSLTLDEVADLEVEQMEKANAETYNDGKYNDLSSLQNYYGSYNYPVPLAALVLTTPVENQVVDCGTVDITAYLAGAAASYGGAEVKGFAVKSVTLNGESVTGSYNALDMSAPGVYTVTYAVEHMGKSLESAFLVMAVSDRRMIANGDFETGNLAGWTALEGKLTNPVISDSTYWGEQLPYNKGGQYFFNGMPDYCGVPEDDTWSLKSTNFILSGSGFVSWRMGGKAAVFKVFKADGTEIISVKQNRFRDGDFPNAALGHWADMGTYVLDLSAYLGEELYVVLADEKVSPGWAVALFDEVVTYYETAPDVENMADTYDNTPGQDPAVVTSPWQLIPTEKVDESKVGVGDDPTASSPVNGDFETGDMTGWTSLQGKFTAPVTSDSTYWNEQLPYNKGGEYFFNGMVDYSGIAEGDGWRVRSTNFTLSGSGFISWRMGGNTAALKVYKADGTEIAYVKQSRFNDAGFPNANVGHWADMGTYVLDLSAYVGQEMYIVLLDEEEPVGWAIATFDEIVTYYETAPDVENMADTYDNTPGQEPAQVTSPWQLAVNLT